MLVSEVKWAAAASGQGSTERALGAPDGSPYAITNDMPSLRLTSFAAQPHLHQGLDDLLASARHGDAPTPLMLRDADIIAFEHNGNQAGHFGGWESCRWVFSDGEHELTFDWVDLKALGGNPVQRDPHVVATGSISGTRFAAFFGIDAETVLAQNPLAGGNLDEVVISFILLKVAPDVDIRSAGFTVTVSTVLGGSPDIDGLGILRQLGEIVVDARLLTYQQFSIPGVVDATSAVERVWLPPGSYLFRQPNLSAFFRFQVTDRGTIDYDSGDDGFLSGRGSSELVVRGFPIAIDMTRLTHGAMPAVFGSTALAPGRTHELVLLPAEGYALDVAPDVRADFAFTVARNGSVLVDSRYGGFATPGDRSLVLAGFPVVIDGRTFPSDLISSLFGIGTLSRLRVHQLMMLPTAVQSLSTVAAGQAATFSLDIVGNVHPLDVPPQVIVVRPAARPRGLRTAFATDFLPSRGSAGRFSGRVQTGSRSSLRSALLKHKSLIPAQSALERIQDLFDGATSERDEDEALKLLLGVENATGLIHVLHGLTWEGLDDDLDESDLTRILDRLKTLVDKRDNSVRFLLRWFFLVDDNFLDTLDLIATLTPYATRQGPDVRHSAADQALFARDTYLLDVGLTALRRLPTHIREFRLILDTAAGPELYQAAQLQALSWEVFYTDLICTQLERGEYAILLQTLPDLFTPAGPGFPFPARNNALFNSLRRWEQHFLAMDRFINILGTPRQRADARRFMDMKTLFMNSFPQVPPGGNPAGLPQAVAAAVQTILAAIGSVGTTITDLKAAVQDIAAAIESISVPKLFGTADDDISVTATNTMSTEDKLVLLPTAFKSELISRMLNGATGDAEEQAILTILRESKAQSQSEFLQLAATATWEMLDGSFDGSEYDDLVALLNV